MLTIAATLATGCVIKVAAPIAAMTPIPLVAASATPKPLVFGTDSPWETVTRKLIALGNLDFLTPRMRISLEGTIHDDFVPSPSYCQFTDLFGIRRTLKIAFTRKDSTTLCYGVTALKDCLGTDVPDPEVSVREPWANTIKFAENGEPIGPSPADTVIDISRPLIGPEESTAPSYTLEVPVEPWKLFQSPIGTSSLQTSLKREKNGKPDYVVFSAHVYDTLGHGHTISLKPTHLSDFSWRVGLMYDDNSINGVDYKVGNQYYRDISNDPDRENFQADLRFDPHSGQVLSGGILTYRFDFGQAGPSEITFDLTRLSGAAGESTARLDSVI